MAILFRLIVVIGGYIAACLAASAFLNVLFLASVGFTAEEVPAIAAGSIIFTIPVVALFVVNFAFVPAVVAILAGELLGKRDWLFYALGGGVVAAIVIGLIRGSAETGSEAMAGANFMLAIIAAGMCGGIGYWLVAGRTAGSWRQPRRDVTSSAP